MKLSLKIRAARRLANRIGARARELRRDLRNHVRSECFRIYHAEKRARGLRLFTAWSRGRKTVAAEESVVSWEAARSAA